MLVAGWGYTHQSWLVLSLMHLVSSNPSAVHCKHASPENLESTVPAGCALVCIRGVAQLCMLALMPHAVMHHAGTVTGASLMASSSNTHSVDFNQRLVFLTIAADIKTPTGGRLALRMPPWEARVLNPG